MNKSEMIAFIRRHPACTIATCEGDQAHARIIMTYRADEAGIVFMTGSEKDFMQTFCFSLLLDYFRARYNQHPY